MISLRQFAGGVAAVAMTAAIASPALAQETTSSMRGVVSTVSGPLAGATVTIINVPSGTVVQKTTDASGGYSARGLRVGGPYTVTITAPDMQPYRAEGIQLTLGQTFALNASMSKGPQDEIVVVGSAIQAANVALGPTATYSTQELQNIPAIGRNLNDIVNTDPRIYVDPTNSGAIQCAGANPRFNSLTVDGVPLNDSFGLNSNGYPTQGMPFPFDSISQVAVEFAPFDVQYGGFSACSINAVTKSGTNEIHGRVFFDYSNDSLTGSKIDGTTVSTGEFNEKRYGASIGLPVVKDKLFLFGAYAKFDGSTAVSIGPEGGSYGRTVTGFTQADYQRVIDVSNNVYGFDPGTTISSAPTAEEKALVRADWNINSRHRADFVFDYDDGDSLAGYSSGFTYSSSAYKRGYTLYSYTGTLHSNWTDNFSTQARVSYVDVDNRQVSQGGGEFGAVAIRNGANTIYLGTDKYRQANKLSYNSLNMKFKADYTWKNHLFTAGYERQDLDIYNLFVPSSQGVYTFNSIDDYENGLPSRIDYSNGLSNDPNNAAAQWGYVTNTAYGQDEFTSAGGALTVTAGLRYDWYTTGDTPTANPAYLTRYGFSNSASLDGKGLLQPRLGFQWEAMDNVSVHGGVGLYSGGNPNVWMSNNYSNNGVSLITTGHGDCLGSNGGFFGGNCSFVADEGGQGRPIWGVPSDLYNQIVPGASSNVNALDPNFKIPSQWKFALGTVWDANAPRFGGEYRINADVMYTSTKSPAIVIGNSLVQTGTGPAGEPIYSDQGLRGGYTDLLLTNSKGADSFNASLSVSHKYDWGLRWTLGYSYSDANDISPMTSSTASSNFGKFANYDVNNPMAATSNYNIKHRVTLRTTYTHDFVQDYTSKISAFASWNTGRPFSYTFDRNSLTGYYQSRPATLLYVPTGPTDPNVVFDANFDQTAFFNYIHNAGLEQYAGGFAPRNAFQSDSWFKVDLKLEQELPGLRKDDRASVYLIFYNFTNFLDSGWGVLRQSGFPRLENIVDASYTNNNSQYLFKTFNNQTVNGAYTNPSLWQIRIGGKYRF